MRVQLQCWSASAKLLGSCQLRGIQRRPSLSLKLCLYRVRCYVLIYISSCSYPYLVNICLLRRIPQTRHPSSHLREAEPVTEPNAAKPCNTCHPNKAGLYADENGACVACLEGFYCPGTGQAVACPQNSTTVSPGSSQQSACICLAGYYFASAELWCEPCQRRRYKPNQGNGECALTCPTNADSELASTSLDDCFCMPEFHANLDSAGKLASCTSCSYQGLICEGGFVKANLTNLTNLSNLSPVHAQPLTKHPSCPTTPTSCESPCVLDFVGLLGSASPNCFGVFAI